MIKKSLRAYITRRHLEFAVLLHGEVVRLPFFQLRKKQVHRALIGFVILSGFTGIDKVQKCDEVLFFLRGLVPDQKLGKELMTQDELAVMDGGKCIFMLRGVRPFLSDKYDLTRHPNYRYTADADPKNVFDMERYMKKQRAVVKPTDTFDVYEIDATT